MVELTRRFFLIGSAAAVAAASLPPGVARAIKVITPPPGDEIIRRSLGSISFGAIHPENLRHAPPRFMEFTLRRGDVIIYQNTLNILTNLRWWAGSEKARLVLGLPDEAVSLECNNVPKRGCLADLGIREYRRDGLVRDYREIRTFNNDGTIGVQKHYNDAQAAWEQPDV